MEPTRATIQSINVSRGGVPKRPIPTASVEANGITVDRQRDLRYHGGPERALCIYSLEQIEALRAEGHPIEPGTTGENITTAGIDLFSLAPGARLKLGPEVEIEITSYCAPCKNIAPSFIDAEFSRMSQKVHPGWSRLYARIVTPGTITAGDPITLVMT